MRRLDGKGAAVDGAGRRGGKDVAVGRGRWAGWHGRLPWAGPVGGVAAEAAVGGIGRLGGWVGGPAAGGGRSAGWLRRQP
ncbi:hypothetical protein GCM10012280_47160 [Wenjunlia tyrosinilytica]|uniref:Uncharacterized protein n=1 Tax=Wenjunlia tyrosinilytica TaxID=1544741 RepID=A0A917ZT81_9ACTN|nr:hypothetical protein GCM10012280_47160 [Wenjunlia tyrosinilytica]